MNTKDYLIKIKETINTPNKWCKGFYATNKNGKPVLVNDDTALCFCISGAMDKVIFYYPDKIKIHNKLFFTLNLNMNLTIFNDSSETTHQDVMDLIDKAIQSCKDDD